jgi:polyhydroxybutyrate depolymerase
MKSRLGLSFSNCLLICLFAGCTPEVWVGPVATEGQYFIELNHDGLARTYQLHVPVGYSGETNLPLHFDLHPWFTNASIMEKLTAFRPLADLNGFILVQPNGINRSWNAGPKCCSPSNEDGIDDVGFIRAIRDDLISRGLKIDTEKVYLDGMSNGGYLANRIACEATSSVNGIAVVVGSIGYDRVTECQPSKPVPVLMISGGDDNIDGRVESFNRWVALNRCSTSEIETFGVFRCETYTDCAADVETTHCVGAGVGHCWPGTGFSLSSCDQDLDASQTILDFFERIE